MKSEILTIDKKIDRLKSNKERQLELSKEEYRILKDSLIPPDLQNTCEVLNYRGISIKVMNEERNE